MYGGCLLCPLYPLLYILIQRSLQKMYERNPFCGQNSIWRSYRDWLLSVALISETLIFIIFTTNFSHFRHFWHPKKRSILSGWRSAINSETVYRTLEVARFFHFYSFVRRQRTPNKVSISDYTAFKRFSWRLNKFSFFVNIAFISFILKFYPLFRAN